jgi:hypothetical protein
MEDEKKGVSPAVAIAAITVVVIIIVVLAVKFANPSRVENGVDLSKPAVQPSGPMPAGYGVNHNPRRH